MGILDSKTSAVCAARHGKLWDKKHQPIGHDWVFHVPPLHPNCRSMLVPASLDEPFEGITGDDWVNSRSLKELQEQFGVGIGQMLHDGTISLHDAVRQGGLVPMTLGELKQKYLFATGNTNHEDFLRQWLGVESYQNMAKVLRREDILPYMHEYGLSEVEGVILRYYTGQGASILNGALYGGQPSQQIEQLAEIMQQALSKLPNYQGIVIRRTNLRELLKQHTVGNIVEYPAFISGSFGGIEVFSEKLHRLEIVSMKGKRIDWISDSDENEVVFLLGSRFRVINKLGRGFFELRELG